MGISTLLRRLDQCGFRSIQIEQAIADLDRQAIAIEGLLNQPAGERASTRHAAGENGGPQAEAARVPASATDNVVVLPTAANRSK
jgi:hypothetical protein